MPVKLTLAILLFLYGCGLNPGGETKGPEGYPHASNMSIHQYMARLSLALAGRSLQSTEMEVLKEHTDVATVSAMLRSWTSEPRFALQMRIMLEHQLGTSGVRGSVNYMLPGNLMEHISREGLPYSHLLSAPYCIDAQGQKIKCDTGAPYSSGILVTRAFLMKNASRFNLHRANVLMNSFACSSYPMEAELQPRLKKTSLVPMFQANDEEEQTDPAAKAGFGNGLGCYSCHGQFGAHAQLFVKFDQDGFYDRHASGVQDPQGEPGRSTKQFFASHLKSSTEARSERSQVFGVEVENLREGAKVITNNSRFMTCAVKNILSHGLGLTSNDALQLSTPLLDDLARGILDKDPDPSLETIVSEVFSDPRIVQSTTFSMRGNGT